MRLDRWDAELRAEVGAGLAAVATDVLERAQQADPAAEFSVRDVLDRALARVAEQGGSFTRSDLIRAVSDELPGNLGLDPSRVRELLDGLSDEALQAALRHVEETDTSAWPEDLRLANGASVFEGPGTARYSTVGQLAADQALRDAAVDRGAHALTAEQADALVAQLAASGRELGDDQAAALRGVLTSGAQVEVMVAAAGTGKSFTVGALADAWTGRTAGAPGDQPGRGPREVGERRVFGLAPSENAAQILAEDGLATANTHRWLGAQRRLDNARPGAPDRFGDDALRLSAGDLVVVDEAGMAGTAELGEIHQRCRAAGAKLLLVGDPRQLAAVGPGGTLSDLAERGIRYELTDVRRFTAEWEGPASLRLRDGDRSALDEYAKHGRLFDAGTADQAEADAARAWLGDAVTGRESLLLVASNEDAARVGAALRAELVGLGLVDEHGVALGADGAQGCVAGVGDVIQARENAWHLAGFEGNDGVPLNRQTFRVTALRPDGGLTVERATSPAAGQTLQLPASYVADRLTFGAGPPRRSPHGSVRRTQLISTYGVGSMVALGEKSFVVGGLDRWRRADDEPDLIEVRLQSRLGVRGFVLPPAPDDAYGAGAPVRLFPELYTCPGEHDDGSSNLRRHREFNPPRSRNECGACGKGLTPSRFVVACDNGHLDEFPYRRWVHGGAGAGNCKLSYSTTGRSSALRSIVISCSCGEEASMDGAFGRGALRSIGHTCSGARPWLGRDAAEQGCSAACRTLQRGSSAAWFPVVRSALSIPPFSKRLYDAVAKYFVIWAEEDDETIVRQAKKKRIIGSEHSEQDVLQAMEEMRKHAAGEGPDPAVLTGFEPADVIRQEEYDQLGVDADEDHFECSTPADPDEIGPPDGIERVMLVKRLREVRVLQTFTRVEAPLESDPPERFAALSSADVDWLPGVEVSGEGVFLCLDEDRLRRWEAKPSAAERRTNLIRRNHVRALADRSGDREAPDSPVRARLVLLHSLAHVLINEWSLDAGYPASALRERLYVSDDMAGVLIYTASSDSAGSLGGLVGQGELTALAASLKSAIERARWCSADPLCMEADASGTDGLNLAACHSCLLLPETSCELNNVFLDRSVLIGSPGNDRAGYFDFQ